MNSSYPGKIRLWEAWTPAQVAAPLPPAEVFDLPALRAVRSPVEPVDRFDRGAQDDSGEWRQVADRLYAGEALNPQAPGPQSGEGAEPYTLQWFLNVEHQRHRRHGRWIPRLLEFNRHAGETLLGLGTGLGTDWVQYARHGASVVVCVPTTDQLAVVRRNFELRTLPGRFLQSCLEQLPLETASIDVACLTGLVTHAPNPRRVIEEVYRVLKPGGKVLAVLPARYDITYWRALLRPWRLWARGERWPPNPTADRLSVRGVRRLFGHFAEHRVYRRQLRRAEVPHPVRWLPVPLLERVFGHVFLLKAFKPLRAAMTHQAAA